MTLGRPFKADKEIKANLVYHHSLGPIPSDTLQAFKDLFRQISTIIFVFWRLGAPTGNDEWGQLGANGNTNGLSTTNERQSLTISVGQKDQHRIPLQILVMQQLDPL